jgi:hypothetical protein
MMYVLKTFGRYHYFKTETARQKFIATLPEWEAKHVECWVINLKGAK